MTTYLSLSGGLDSTCLLAQAAATGDEVVAVSFNYGQRHYREIRSATDVAAHYGVEHRIMDLPRLTSTSLTEAGDGKPVPHGHYADDMMRMTVVQGRNLLFISTLVSMANTGDTIMVGVHTGDHAIYPDCRPDFILPLETAIFNAYKVRLLAPYLGTDKAGIVLDGAAHDAPMGLSWSCYEGGQVHCGRCGTCVERAEAFHVANIPDPTVYDDPIFWTQVTRV